MDELDEQQFLDEQAEFEEKKRRTNLLKGVLGGLGDVMQAQADRPSAYEYLYGKVGSPTNFNRTMDRAANSVQGPVDPSDTSKKAYEFLKQKREMAQAQAADDPNHADAATYRAQMEELMPSLKGKLGNMTLAQMERTSPIIMAKIRGEIERQNAQVARDDRNAARQEARADRQATRDDAKALKEQEKLEKKQASMAEVENRRRNIEDNLTLLEKMVQDKGTYELTGSHNNDLDRRVEAIATDMAKLADPDSVARPAEVEAFKKGLIRASATDMTNDTALQILKNFRGEVGTRAANAYKVRGLQDPGAQAGVGATKTPQQLAQEELARRAAAKNTARK